MIDRASFLRRAGAGAAGVSLAGLLGPAAALASGGGDFPDHPRWRFVFVSHDTLDPLFVATQFGAQDAAALVHCTVQWTGSPSGSADETARALRSAVSHKADGIAVSLPDVKLSASAIEAARKAKIPVVAFGLGAGNGRVPFVGQDPECVRAAGGEGARAAGRAREGCCSSRRRRCGRGRTRGWPVFRPSSAAARRSSGSRATSASWRPRSKTRSAPPGAPSQSTVTGTVALGKVLKRSRRSLPAGGFDLLPDDLALVAGGQLAFVVDQQPYVQGFSPVMQLFLARISEGTVRPSGTGTSILLRKADVQPFVATKSRFEGSSSRHEYPLRRT